MAAENVFLHVAVITILVGVFPSTTSTRAPAMYLFRSREWAPEDKFITLTTSSPDLSISSLDFDDQAHSYYLHGTAIMYEYKNYNGDNPNGEVLTKTHTTSTWLAGTDRTDPQLAMTSSVRLLGYNSGPNHYPSVTLFEKNNFGGLREELVTGSKGTLSYTNSVSLVNIGVNDWTFYDEVNYSGRGDCVKGSSDEHGVRFLGNSTALGFSLNGKRSVEKGCWAKHGVPLNNK